MDDLVTTKWLAEHLGEKDLKVVDASLHLPTTGRDARTEYEAAHIPGARFFDIDEISDARSELPHMAPPVEKFMSRMRAMGVATGIRLWSMTAWASSRPPASGGSFA